MVVDQKYIFMAIYNGGLHVCNHGNNYMTGWHTYHNCLPVETGSGRFPLSQMSRSDRNIWPSLHP